MKYRSFTHNLKRINYIFAFDWHKQQNILLFENRIFPFKLTFCFAMDTTPAEKEESDERFDSTTREGILIKYIKVIGTLQFQI